MCMRIDMRISNQINNPYSQNRQKVNFKSKSLCVLYKNGVPCNNVKLKRTFMDGLRNILTDVTESPISKDLKAQFSKYGGYKGTAGQKTGVPVVQHHFECFFSGKDIDVLELKKMELLQKGEFTRERFNDFVKKCAEEDRLKNENGEELLTAIYISNISPKTGRELKSYHIDKVLYEPVTKSTETSTITVVDKSTTGANIALKEPIALTKSQIVPEPREYGDPNPSKDKFFDTQLVLFGDFTNLYKRYENHPIKSH